MYIIVYLRINYNKYTFIYRVTQIKTYSWDNAQVVLVGNKSDMQNDRAVAYERGKRFAEQLGLEFFETSAKENYNVKQVFERLVNIITYISGFII